MNPVNISKSSIEILYKINSNQTVKNYLDLPSLAICPTYFHSTMLYFCLCLSSNVDHQCSSWKYYITIGITYVRWAIKLWFLFRSVNTSNFFKQRTKVIRSASHVYQIHRICISITIPSNSFISVTKFWVEAYTTLKKHGTRIHILFVFKQLMIICLNRVVIFLLRHVPPFLSNDKKTTNFDPPDQIDCGPLGTSRTNLVWSKKFRTLSNVLKGIINGWLTWYKDIIHPLLSIYAHI